MGSSKKKQISKHQEGGVFRFLNGGTFKQAFDKARKQGNRYFWYKGKTYNTMKKGEDPAEWAKNFKDNSTSAGNNRILTDVGLSGGWRGIKGANAGRYNSKGLWTKFRTDVRGKYPLAAKGDNVTLLLDWGDIDKPNDLIVTIPNKNKSLLVTKNASTNVVIGLQPSIQPIKNRPQKGSSLEYLYRYPQQHGYNGGTYVVTPLVPGWKDPWK